jgi:hypothetical protein
MHLLNKAIVCFILSVIGSLLSAPFVKATVDTIAVPAGGHETKMLSLAVDDRVAIRFTVVGAGSDNALDFWIVCPNGTMIAASSNGVFTYAFVCDKEGSYTLHFSNPATSVEKLVSLNYEVQHYIFGMPQMLFMVIVIVGVSVAAVSVFVFMGKPR